MMVSSAWAQIAQTVEISSSPNPVGSGARALGMGGAFIGVADDATAASWNPAGLIQLETPELSVVGSYNKRVEDTTYVAFPEASGPQEVSIYDLNYFSAAFPFNTSFTNMIFSLNLQHMYDFNKRVQFSYTFQDLSPPALIMKNSIDFEQSGAYRALSPALAVQVTPYVSLGITLNLWDKLPFENRWKIKYRSRGGGTFAAIPFGVKTRIDEEYEADGFKIDLTSPGHWQNCNFHLGLMYEVNQMLTIGAVYKSGFENQVRHSYHFQSSIVFPTAPAANTHNDLQFIEDVKINMPASYGLGFALRVSDAQTFDLDVYHTEWKDFFLRDGSGNEMNPITGKSRSESDTKNTTQVRIGGEYLFILDRYVIPLRAGLFYDPEPAEAGPDDFYGLSLGTGITYKNFVYDIAYQYRFGRDVRSVVVGNADSTQDVDQHTVYMSLIYHF